MKVRQVELVRKEKMETLTEGEPVMLSPQVMMVTWVPAELARVGTLLRDEEGRTWRVQKAFTVELERDARGWSVPREM